MPDALVGRVFGKGVHASVLMHDVVSLDVLLVWLRLLQYLAM